jgi:hypothetical protein
LLSAWHRISGRSAVAGSPKVRCAQSIAATASAQELQQVQGRVIRPAHVLQHHQRRRPALEFIECRHENRLAVARSNDREQCLFCLPRDIVQRRERPRGE